MRLQIAQVARQKKNWSMRQVADRMGLDHQTVMYWNQGRAYPRFPSLIKLLELLECTLEQLLKGTDE